MHLDAVAFQRFGVLKKVVLSLFGRLADMQSMHLSDLSFDAGVLIRHELQISQVVGLVLLGIIVAELGLDSIGGQFDQRLARAE